MHGNGDGGRPGLPGKYNQEKEVVLKSELDMLQFKRIFHHEGKKNLPLEEDCQHKQWYIEDYSQERHYLVPLYHPL